MVLVTFALRNTAPVTLNFVQDHVWQAPLVVVLLVFFAAGTAMGLLAMSGVVFRQRREISRLKQLQEARGAEITELPPPIL